MNEFLMHGATIQGLYKSTMHLFIRDRIITVGHSIGKGKHHILTEDAIAYHLLPLSSESIVTIKDRHIHIGDQIELEISDDAPRSYLPYLNTFRLQGKTYDTIMDIRKLIEVDHHENFYNFKKSDRWLSYQFERIGTFLAQPDLHRARAILGLGMGLTPLGDDILTGFILGLNTVNQTLPWIETLVSYAQTETSKLSAQNLKDTLNRYYPEAFIDMIEEIMIHQSLEKTKTILNLGATSGAGILTGFIYGCMQR